MVDKIKELCKQKGTTIKQLEKVLGFSNGSIAKWDKNAPRAERVSVVADYFGVDISYLLDLSSVSDAKKAPNENIESNREIDLSADEWKLIAYYRDLSEQGKQKVLDYVADLLLAGIYKRHNKHEMVSGG